MLNNFKARIGTNLGSYTLDVSTNSIVIGNDFPFTVDKDAFLYIYNKTQSKSLFSINPYVDTITVSGNSLLVNPINCSIGASDLIDMYVSIPPLFSDVALDAIKVIQQNSVAPLYTDLFEVATAESVDDSANPSLWVGSYEIDTTGFSKLGVFVSYTKGTTVGAQMRLVTVTTSGSTTYFDLENLSNYYKPLDESSATTNRYYLFDVTGIQYIVIQTKGGLSVGTGTVTINVKLQN